jgi:hypothetical protein
MPAVHRKILVIGLALGWLAVAATGFVAYHDASRMKFFLAMNVLMLIGTLLVSGSWIREKLKEEEN